MFYGYYLDIRYGNNFVVWYEVLSKNKVVLFDDKYIRNIFVWKYGYIFWWVVFLIWLMYDLDVFVGKG